MLKNPSKTDQQVILSGISSNVKMNLSVVIYRKEKCNKDEYLDQNTVSVQGTAERNFYRLQFSYCYMEYPAR